MIGPDDFTGELPAGEDTAREAAAADQVASTNEKNIYSSEFKIGLPIWRY